MNTKQTEPLAVSPREAATLTSLSKRKIQQLMSRGALPFRKIGRRTVIPFAALKKLLDADVCEGEGDGD